MSKVKAVAATIALMLGASVSYAQSSQTPLPVFPSSESPGNVQFQQLAYPRDQNFGTQTHLSPESRPSYVACWAEVPSQNTAYFSATFAAPSVSRARKEFRTLVTTQYGPVSKLKCALQFSKIVMNEQVAKWKDSAREKNALVDTDWRPVAALPRTSGGAQAAAPNSSHAAPGTSIAVPGNSNFGGTAANQSSFQR